MIEVTVSRGIIENDLILRRSSTALRAWYFVNKTNLIDFESNGLESDPLYFLTGDEVTIYIEWAASNHGTSTIELVDAVSSLALDTLTFHTFTSALIAFGGDGQDPSDTDDDGSIGDPVLPFDPDYPNNREGIFDIAQEFYGNGWDVWAYNENVFDGGVEDTAPYDRVKNVFPGTSIGVFGYSHGGGATQIFMDQLRLDGLLEGVISVSASVDAIDHEGIAEENDRPDSDYHLNIYEDIDLFLDGGPTTGLLLGDEEINVSMDAGWDALLDHYTIDDDAKVQQKVKDWIYAHLNR